jgi:glycerate dehydrogenase
MKIVVIDGWTLNPGDNPWDGLAALGELIVYDRSRPGEVVERAQGAEVLVVNKAPVPAPALEKLPELRFITMIATGYDPVDVAAAGRLGIPVSNVPVYGTDSVAQHVLALVLEFTNRVGLHDAAVKAGEWSANPDWCFWKTPLMELAGKTMGIIGFGRIGRRVGELAHALGMAVLAHDVKQDAPPAYRPFAWAGVEEVFRGSDVISLHSPLTRELRGFVDARLLALMKPTALLINAARGPLVNEADLAAALDAGRLAGAGLDVVGVEPIRPDNPLLRAKNVLLTPHNAWEIGRAHV